MKYVILRDHKDMVENDKHTGHIMPLTQARILQKRMAKDFPNSTYTIYRLEEVK